MDQARGYAAGLEEILKNSHLTLKESVAHFQEMCHMVSPDRNLPPDVVTEIRKTYREIQDQLTRIKGIQQLLEGKYRQHYRRNHQRDKEIVECGFLAKNHYLRFEYTLKEIEAKRRLREQERRLREYDQTGFVPWFRSAENQHLLLKTLDRPNGWEERLSNDAWPQDRRHTARSTPESFSLFILSGEVDFMDALEGRIRLREYDITERSGPDEFRGTLIHFRRISAAEEENIVRRLAQSGSFSKPKGLLFPIHSSNDLKKEVLGFSKRLLRGLAAGEVKTISI